MVLLSSQEIIKSEKANWIEAGAQMDRPGRPTIELTDWFQVLTVVIVLDLIQGLVSDLLMAGASRLFLDYLKGPFGLWAKI